MGAFLKYAPVYVSSVEAAITTERLKMLQKVFAKVCKTMHIKKASHEQRQMLALAILHGSQKSSDEERIFSVGKE